jgi:glycosyltransferase involved in cell wall biosynthesis
MPRVSVHMPVYNAMPYLAAAVESILAQTLARL